MAPRFILGIVAAVVLTALVVVFIVARSKRKEIILLLSTLVVACILAEVGLRLFHPEISDHDRMFHYDPQLGWTFIPDKTGLILYPGEAFLHIRTNSLGFRDDEPPPVTDGEKRIMVVGDSFVSNVSVPLESVFTEVMQRRLSHTTVINCGVNGYGEVQEYLLLQKMVDVLKPDLVLLLIYPRNDFDDNLGSRWEYPRPHVAWNPQRSTFDFVPAAAPPRRGWFFHARAVYRDSHLYHLVLRGFTLALDRMNAAARPTPETPPELYLCRRDAPPETGTMYAAMDTLLLRISWFLERKRVPVVFGIAPSIIQVEDAFWTQLMKTYHRNPNDYVRSLPDDHLLAFGAQHGLRMVDLFPALRARAKDGTVLYNPHEQHWNVEGNRVVAGALLDYLRGDSTLAGP